MFATLSSPSVPLIALIDVARAFTPRFEVVGTVVVLDVSGLSRLFGGPRDIGEHLQRAAEASGGAVRVAVAPTMTTAVLMVLGRPGLSIVAAASADALLRALAPLSIATLAEFERTQIKLSTIQKEARAVAEASSPSQPRLAGRADALQVTPTGPSTDTPGGSTGGSTGGWRHPRDSHEAGQARKRQRPDDKRLHTEEGSAHARFVEVGVRYCEGVLRRWGIATLGALAALPPAELSERLGDRGVSWQRWACGQDARPLVPWVDEEPFEAVLELEWPIEGLEPLSFVLARVLEPLSARLEQADRGAAAIHTTLHLTSKEVHARTLALPAPMRDAKTLRTLVLLDLESHPPAAAVDRVRVCIEPTPGRVLQWTMLERAQPAPEQVSTLVARLSALMGEGHVGSPVLTDGWKPGAFTMTGFTAAAASVSHMALPSTGVPTAIALPKSPCALRRFRLPVPVRVRVQDGRPVRVITDRHGISGGMVVQAAGPWRTSGAWWEDGASWDRDEWDIAMADGTLYRLYVERSVGQWFLGGIVD